MQVYTGLTKLMFLFEHKLLLFVFFEVKLYFFESFPSEIELAELYVFII